MKEKKRIFLLSLFAIVLVAVLIIAMFRKIHIIDNSALVESDISSFEYFYGSYNKGYYSYIITVGENSIVLNASGMNGVDLDISKEIDNSAIEELSNIINDNKIYEWDGFNKEAVDASDGYSFKLKITYKNGQTINANGYMKYPKNYDYCHKILLDFFESIK